MARYATEYYAGKPAITVNRFGAGRAVYVGVMGDQRLFAPLARWCLTEAGLPPILSTPPSIEVTVRQDTDQTYLFLLNHGADSHAVSLPRGGTDLVSGERLQGQVTLAPYQVVIVAADSV